MESSEKPLTRDALVSMQVIDSKGRLVGKVTDVGFTVGKSGITLTIANDAGESKSVSWEDIQAASDFILLKPQALQPAQPTQTQPTCPTCSKPLTWIPQYQRWYCYNDKKYV